MTQIRVFNLKIHVKEGKRQHFVSYLIATVSLIGNNLSLAQFCVNIFLNTDAVYLQVKVKKIVIQSSQPILIYKTYHIKPLQIESHIPRKGFFVPLDLGGVTYTM